MPGIGPTLRDARIRARIDMAEVEARTKIRAKYLRAIENEEWDLLPGPVYVKSFLRTYGDYLGLDSRMLVEEFKRRYEQPAEHELQPLAPPRRDRDGDRGPRQRLSVPPWLAVVGVLIVVAVVLYVVGRNSGSNKTTTTQSAHAGTHPKKHHHTTPTRTRANAPPPKPRTVTLQMVPTAPVYVCLINGSRKKVIPGITYTTGQTIPSETGREFFLTLGNANVHMKVNGKPITVTPSPTPLSYRIRPRGTSIVASGSQPTCP
jgi:Helix-turn-helix domain